MSNPTSNYSFQMPTNTDLVYQLPADFEVFGQAVDTQMKTNADAATQKATLTTKGDLYAASAASTPARLAVGTNGQVLTADSTAATGIKWATPATAGFVGCGLYRSGTGTIANATATIIDWNSERFDTNGFHDNVTNNTRITIPSGYAGKYLVTWQWGFNFNATGYREVELLLNGIQFPQSYNLVTFNGYSTQSAALVYPLSVGDYIQMKVTQNSGGSLDSVAAQNFFSVVYLGA